MEQTPLQFQIAIWLNSELAIYSMVLRRPRVRNLHLMFSFHHSEINFGSSA